MKKILISYSNINMQFSLKRIGKQAKKLGIFDEIILYTPESLPEYIKNSPLMDYNIGGGYWAWKPIIIKETINNFGSDCIIVYVDAGCSLKKSNEWNRYFSLMTEYNTLLFEYQDIVNYWDKFGQTSSKIKYWTKKSTYDFFENLLGYSYGDYNKIWGGLIICNGRNNKFLDKWIDIVINNPELIMNPTEDEKRLQKELAFHKHDQSIITPLAHYYSNIIIEKETSESRHPDAAVIGSRIRAKTRRDYNILITKLLFRKILGENTYNKIKESILKFRIY